MEELKNIQENSKETEESKRKVSNLRINRVKKVGIQSKKSKGRANNKKMTEKKKKKKMIKLMKKEIKTSEEKLIIKIKILKNFKKNKLKSKKNKKEKSKTR